MADPSDTREVHDAGDGNCAVTLGEVTLALAWNVRGDPRNAAFASEAARTLGLPLPAVPMTSTRGERDALLWLGPRAWLYITGAAPTQNDFNATRTAINSAGGALFDVSASYVAWRISGASAALVLNRACPLDLHPCAFLAGASMQSVLGHINALFYKPGEDASFVVMVARSFAPDAWHTLCEAAASDGYRVVAARPFATSS